MRDNDQYFPRQGKNTSECGVFIMMYADFFINELPLNFTLTDMTIFRQKIFSDLSRDQLMYSNDLYPTYSDSINKYLIKFQTLISNPDKFTKRNSIDISRILIHNLIVLKSDYLIIHNVITKNIDLNELIKCFSDFEPITFNCHEPYDRFQSTTIINSSLLSTYLERIKTSLFIFLSSLSSCHLESFDCHFEIKLLKSNSQCKSQEQHCNINNPEHTKHTYAFIISIMPDTKLMSSSNEIINIPLYGMAIFKGDFFHCGASYNYDNYLIYGTCSTKKISNDKVISILF